MTQHLRAPGFPWRPPDAKAGEFYKLRVKDHSPTQFAVGKAEVAVVPGACARSSTRTRASCTITFA